MSSKREQPTNDIMTGQSMLKFTQNFFLFVLFKIIKFLVFFDVAFNSNSKADIVMMGENW